MESVVKDIGTERAFVLTGHHRQDQTETILMKMMRGAHVRGIRGMDAKSTICVGDTKVTYLRPLLQFSKSELINHNIQKGIPWKEDESNYAEGSSAYLRNRVRNELIPLLGQLCGGAEIVDERVEHFIEQIEHMTPTITTDTSNKVEVDSTPFFSLTDFDPSNYLHTGSLYSHIVRNRANNKSLTYKQLKQCLALIQRGKGKIERGIDIGQGEIVKVEEKKAILWVEKKKM